MTRIGDYAFVNAKVRAMRSRMLTDTQIESLLAARGLDETILALRQTPYARIADDLAVGYDLRQTQLALEEEEVDLHLRLAGLLSGCPAAVVRHLATSYEIKNLKTVLRLWHRSLPIEPAYLLRDFIVHRLPLAEIAQSENIQTVVRLLENTPYAAAVSAAVDEFTRGHALFPVEASLDTTYFQELLQLVDGLPSSDRNAARRVIGGEIDLCNLNWVLSCKFYHRLPASKMSQYLIPSGLRILPEVAVRLYDADKLQSVLAEVADLPENVAEKARGLDGSSAGVLLVAVVNQLLLREARRVLSGFPFNIGTVLGFLVLKRLETKNLIVLLECVFWGKDPGARRSYPVRAGGLVS